MRIVLDTLGGDNPPEEIITGGIEAAKELGVEVALAGPRELIEKALAAAGRSAERISIPITIIEAQEAITMEDSPTEAIRRKRSSSLIQGILAVKEGKADGFVSPGNTGAVMAAATLELGRLAGIDRPALAVLIPALDGRRFLLLDVGANADCSPLNLKQFAIMGQVYMREVFGIDHPKVGLLNIGTERGKGSELARKTYPLLEELEGFVGNVESNRILQGGVDVVVCDGFVGNVLLKGLEGSSHALLKLIKRTIQRSLPAKLGAFLLSPALQRVKEELDAAHYGGAPLLGVRGVVIVAHGHSDAEAIKNAIRVAKSAVENELPRRIEEGIARLAPKVTWFQTLRRKRERERKEKERGEGQGS